MLFVLPISASSSRLPSPSDFSDQSTDPPFNRIAKVYEFETYDYPTQIQESIADFSSTVGTTVTNFAAANLQGTNLPAPAPVQPKPIQHKTLPHALCRASLSAVTDLSAASKDDDKLTSAFTAYGTAWEKIASARLQQDETIREAFLQPWQQTLSTNISVALKARQAVRTSRLELDAAKQMYVCPISNVVPTD
jgi:hypothetical protein